MHSFYNTFMGRKTDAKKTVEWDLAGDDRFAWERARLDESIDLTELAIDPAPFQLVERTSMYKVGFVLKRSQATASLGPLSLRTSRSKSGVCDQLWTTRWCGRLARITRRFRVRTTWHRSHYEPRR